MSPCFAVLVMGTKPPNVWDWGPEGLGGLSVSLFLGHVPFFYLFYYLYLFSSMVSGRIGHLGIQSTAATEILSLLTYVLLLLLTHAILGSQVSKIRVTSLQYGKYPSLWYTVHGYV